MLSYLVFFFSAIVAAICASEVPPPSDPTFLASSSDTTLHIVSLKAYPNARCNDGSVAAYYFAPPPSGLASSAAPTQWLVYLEGGGWCWDEASCSARNSTAPSLMSSSKWGITLTQGGIFSSNLAESALANAAKVFVRYCSSDGHMGNRSNEPGTFGWEFRGHAIVTAVLTDLVLHRGLGGSAAPSVVVFGGGSAGGRGAMVTLDEIPSILARAGATAASRGRRLNGQAFAFVPPTIVGFLDSPLWLDLAPLDGFVGLPATTKALLSLANPTAVIPRDCASVYPGEELWKCIFGQFRMTFVHTSYLLIASQCDAFQLGEDLGHPPRTGNSTEMSFAKVFADSTVATLSHLPSKPQSPSSSVFSMSCFSHSTSLTPSYYGVTVDGVSMDAALRSVLDSVASGGTRAPGRWVDSCAGYACGAGCRHGLP